MRTYKFRLYTNKNKRLHRTIDTAGRIYNHMIALHRRYYRLYRKSLNVFCLQKHITKLKRTKRYAFWNILGSQSIQDIAQRIDRGYKLFFRNRAAGLPSRPPGFRKVKKYRSFTLKQAGWKLPGGNRVRILGEDYRFVKSREIPGEIKTVTIKRDALGYLWISFAVEEERSLQPSRTMTGKIAGMDFGLKTFLTLDNGEKVVSPLFFTQGSRRIAKANQSLSRKKRGSKNRRKARMNLAREHWKIACRREDFQWKLVLSLVRSYDILCVEDLNIKAMQRLWGRKISDLGFADFLRKLEYLCFREGKQLLKIDRWYPSSKTCSSCGSVLETLSLSKRKWTCPECHAHHDRDINAAVNIRNEGLRVLSINSVGASTDMPETVRPEISGVLQRA